MNHWLLALLACLLAAPLLRGAEPEAKPATDAAERAKWPELLVGRWRIGENRGPRFVVDQIDHYHKDGRVESEAEIFAEGKETRHLEFEAKWQLAGDRISYEVTRTNMAELKDIGDKWTETITALNDAELRFLNPRGEERVEKRLAEQGYSQSKVTLAQTDAVMKARGPDAKALADYIKKLQDVCERQLKEETVPANLDLVVLIRPGGQAKTWLASKPEIQSKMISPTLRKELDAILPPKVKEGPVAFAISGTLAGGVPHAAAPGFPTPKEWLDQIKGKEVMLMLDGIADLVLPPKP